METDMSFLQEIFSGVLQITLTAVTSTLTVGFDLISTLITLVLAQLFGVDTSALGGLGSLGNLGI